MAATESAPTAPASPSFLSSTIASAKEWFRENGMWYATSIAAHAGIFGLLALLGGAIHVAATTGEAPLIEAVIDTTVPEVPVEKFEVDNASIEVAELSTESLTIAEPPAMAAVEAQYNDDSAVFEAAGGGTAAESAADFGGLGGFALASGTGPAGGGGIGTGVGTSTKAGSGGSGEGFGGRGTGSREAMAGNYGGTAATERSVAGGLNWLARHQNPDGSWSFDKYHQNCKDKSCAGDPNPEGKLPGVGASAADMGATAMALLPFLAAGQTPESSGPYKSQITKGLLYMVKNQNPKTGALYGKAGGGPRMYVHGLATIVLCEGYGMTKSANLRIPAQRAIQFIEASQHPDQGGWRYYVAGETPTGGDTSVVGWQMMAIKSAIMAGLEVNPKTMEKARVYMKLASSGKSGGLFSYEPKGGASPSMTAVGLLCMQVLGIKRDDPAMAEGMNYLMQHLPGKYARDSYYFYYATQVMHNLPGPEWDKWNRATRRYLIETQVKDGCAEGSWDPNKPTVDRWGAEGGRLMVTSVNTLNLEVYYRFLPLYKMDRDGTTAAAMSK
jgi:hypothetical protein